MFTVAACSSAVHGPAAPADLGLLPPRCIGCRGLSGGGLDLCLCPRCRSEILAAPLAPLPLPGLDEVLAVTPYAGAALGVVASLKGGAVPAAAEVAAELIAEALGSVGRESVLVPVGPSWLHRMSRGLDPAEEIAGALGSRLGIDVQYPLRRIDRRRQRGRPRERRLADPPRFRAAAEPPPRAILVDDVLTTGGTLRSCAETLRAAGSTRVSAAVFAASPPPGRLG